MLFISVVVVTVTHLYLVKNNLSRVSLMRISCVEENAGYFNTIPSILMLAISDTKIN